MKPSELWIKAAEEARVIHKLLSDAHDIKEKDIPDIIKATLTISRSMNASLEALQRGIAGVPEPKRGEVG